MMTSIKQAFMHAALAQASYYDLGSADTRAKIKERLYAGGSGMTEWMAGYISENYTVVNSRIEGGFSNIFGYQGVLFIENKNPTHYIVANRGTEGNVTKNIIQDLLADVLLATESHTHRHSRQSSSVANARSFFTGGGTDSVESALSWTLGANLENLWLTGNGAINGTGNALANRLQGNQRMTG